MAEEDKDRDEEWFKEVYGNEYTGPTSDSRREGSLDSAKAPKRPGTSLNASAGESDQEEERRDPNAVPTDFTSREAKVREAKAKAIERNWKRRKEEELKCHICGETGHFPQGCPTTLGANRRKSGEVAERIYFKDKRLKPRLIGTGGSVIQGIERDTGCHLQLEDNAMAGIGAFCVRISGPDQFTVSNAVNVVNNLVDKVQDEWNQQGVRRSHGPHHNSSVDPSPLAQMQHTAAPKLREKNFYGSRTLHAANEENRVIEQIAPQLEVRRQWETGFSEESNGRAVPGPGKVTNSLISNRQNTYYYSVNHERGSYSDHGGGISVQEPKTESLAGYEEQPFPRTLEELEQRFLEETMELSKQQAAEEDRENDRHHEQLRSIQEHYQQKMIQLRAKQTENRKEFLQHEAQSRQQQTSRNYFTSSGGSYLRNYGKNSYEHYDTSASMNVQGHEAVLESFRASAQHCGNSTQAYHRKQGYETKSSRGSPRYDYDPYARSSSAYRTYG